MSKTDTTQRENDNLRKVYIVSVSVHPFLEQPLLFYKPLHFYAKILKPPPPSPQRKFQKLELPFIKDRGDGGVATMVYLLFFKLILIYILIGKHSLGAHFVHKQTGRTLVQS